MMMRAASGQLSCLTNWIACASSCCDRESVVVVGPADAAPPPPGAFEAICAFCGAALAFGGGGGAAAGAGDGVVATMPALAPRELAASALSMRPSVVSSLSNEPFV